MRKLRKISKEYYLRRIVACWMICSMLLTFAPVRTATALPNGWDVKVGNPNIVILPGGVHVQVTVDQMETIIHWDSLNTSPTEFLSFLQQAGLSNAAVLNRVVSGDMTLFNGTLNGVGMRIFMINPAGIIFGQTAKINVSQLIASSLDITDSDFLDGAPYEFIGGATAGDVTFNGYAHNIDAERLYLIGKNVFNYGGLKASDCVVMAAGDTVLISEPDSSVVVEAFMPEGWVSGSGVHVVGNDNGGITVDEGLDGDGTAQVILAAGDIWSRALVKAYSDGGSDAVATVDIDAAGYVDIKDNVIAEAVGNGENNATATININAGGNVEVTNGWVDKYPDTEVRATAKSGLNNTATVGISAEGNVDVITDGANAKVIAEAYNEYWAYDVITNNIADVLICNNGGVRVEGKGGSEAKIEALAQHGYSNTASVGIGAKGKEGVQVIADNGGKASISSKAEDGQINTASTIVCTQGGVDVKATYGSDGAKILAQAQDGLTNDAYIGVCAVDDVVVQAGMVGMKVISNNALIKAEAAAMGCSESSADAETVVVSHQGNVEVLAYNGGNSGIEAEARSAHLNTAKVGVSADQVLVAPEEGDPYYSGGNVIVEAQGDSEAQILAWAHDAASIYGYDSPTILGENTAQTVVCAPGEVRVYADEGSEARIKSRAGWYGEEEAINKATTRVYASDVNVGVASLHHGQGIWAWAHSDNSDNPHVPGDMMLSYLGGSYDGSYYCMDEHGEVAWTNGDAVLYIQDYTQAVGCPDCPPCPCEEEAASPAAALAGLIAPVAPLPVYEIPSLRGCPELTLATAAELGISGETLQIGIGTALAHNSSIQPCQACASLVNAASILKDENGSRMAAMVQAFNAMAPADAPYTPEMATSIAMAFEDAAEGSQYASAMEFIDAFVQYAAALDELGSPVGDSIAFVMDKYGAGISDNGNMASFVAARIASGETF